MLCVLDLVCLTLQWGWCAWAFRRGGVPENRQGHCLLLCITLPPSGHLREEANRRLAAVTHPVMSECLENTLFPRSHSQDIKDVYCRHVIDVILDDLCRATAQNWILSKTRVTVRCTQCKSSKMSVLFYSISRKYIISVMLTLSQFYCSTLSKSTDQFPCTILRCMTPVLMGLQQQRYSAAICCSGCKKFLWQEKTNISKNYHLQSFLFKTKTVIPDKITNTD